MPAYLVANPPVRQQWYASRRRPGVSGDPLTGCTMLHTSESIMDSVGPDTGAENVARFIQGRDTPGSYHDLVDSDSIVDLIPYEHAAFHDGTGSNNWALSISFACSTADWKRMSPAKRAAFLRNGAKAFARQQAWRKSRGLPLTQLRYITKAQSDAGQSGFCCHGWRDPARRSDPGTSAPNEFPFDEFLTHCRAALAGESEEDDMYDQAARDELVGRIDQGFARMATYLDALQIADTRTRLGIIQYGVNMLVNRGTDGPLDPKEFAAALVPILGPMVAEAGSGATAEQIAEKLAERLAVTVKPTLP